MTKKYTDEAIVKFFNDFRTRNGRFPAQSDLRASEEAPDVKTIERRFGGIVAFRKQHGMGDDLRSGEARSAAISRNIAERSSAYWDLYRKLVEKFGDVSVHREGRIIRVFRPDGKKKVVGFFYPSQASNFDQGLRYARKTTADIIVCLNPAVEPPVWPDNVVSINRINDIISL